jgi:hypothetical protein
MGWGTSRGGLRCFDFLHVKQMTFIIAKSEDVSVTESGNPIAQWQVIEKGLRRWRLSTPLCVTATLSTSPH